MRLTVLGCSGPYPAANEACSGYLLESGSSRILIDCGTGVLSRLFALCDPAELTAIMLSHLHFDHAGDLLPLRYYLEPLGVSLPLFLPPGETPLSPLLQSGAFLWHDIADGFETDGLVMEAIPVRHPVPAYAMRFTGEERFVYTGDTNTIPSLDGFCRDAGLLLADACFPEALWREDLPHMSAAHAARLAARSGAKRLVLTHFRPDIPISSLLSEARAVYPDAQAAAPGLRLTL